MKGSQKDIKWQITAREFCLIYLQNYRKFNIVVIVISNSTSNGVPHQTAAQKNSGKVAITTVTVISDSFIATLDLKGSARRKTEVQRTIIQANGWKIVQQRVAGRVKVLKTGSLSIFLRASQLNYQTARTTVVVLNKKNIIQAKFLFIFTLFFN